MQTGIAANLIGSMSVPAVSSHARRRWPNPAYAAESKPSEGDQVENRFVSTMSLSHGTFKLTT
jgi:hypothetical protein